KYSSAVYITIIKEIPISKEIKQPVPPLKEIAKKLMTTEIISKDQRDQAVQVLNKYRKAFVKELDQLEQTNKM
ncbi:1482_t:CDS:1, partial [Acaulospora morrowiae]